MNNLEQMKKRKNRVSAIIAILIVLNLLLLLVFATTSDGPTTTSTYSTEVESETGNEGEETTTIVGDTQIADVATGANFTIALDSSGNVYAWGLNDKGQLGNGSIAQSITKQPVLIGENNPLNNVKQIAAGEYHAAALTNNGEVYIWGYNYFGQTGSDSLRKILYATKTNTNGQLIAQIECGADYTLALTNSGDILGLGDSTNGQLGYYNDLSFTSIRNIEDQKDTKELTNIKTISAGNNHVVALKNDGTVWTWGDETGSGFEFATISEVTGFESQVTQIQSGNDVSMALDTNGNVYTWNLGNTTANKVDLTSVVNSEGNSVQIRTDNSIAIVNKTYYIIDTNNNVYAWGQNNAGQVGAGSTSSSVSVPTKIKTAKDMNIDGAPEINDKIDKVSSSVVEGIGKSGSSTLTSTNGTYDTVYAINEKGYVLGWGYAGTDITVDPMATANTLKLLGDGTRNYADYIGSISVLPIVCDDIELDITAAGISAGENKKDLGKLLTEYITGGRVNLYEDPNAVTVNKLDSLDIKTLNEDIATYNKGVVTGVAQGKTTLQVKSTKNTIFINVLVKDENTFTFAKIESGRDFTIALKADGTVWAWGHNSYLGLNNIIMPIQIKMNTTANPQLARIKDIAVGEYSGNAFVLVLAEDGSVWSWGYNRYGQLGNGTTSNSESKNILNDVVDLKQVQCYDLKTTTVYDKQEVTINTSTDATTGTTTYTDATTGAIYVPNGEDYADESGNIVVKKDTDGKLYRWNSTENKFVTIPREITEPANDMFLTNVESISAGRYHALALTKDGSVYGWGYNGYGQLGNGTTSSYETRAKKVDLTNIVDKDGNKETIKQIDAGYETSYIVTKSGNVYAFGYNGNYQFGQTSPSYSTKPVQILTSYQNKIVKMSAGMNNGYALALSIDGKVYMLGYKYGYPATREVLGNVVDVEATYNSYAGIAKFADGTVGYWTNNNYPIRVANLTNAENTMIISGGQNFYTIAKTDGTVWSTGSNNHGQLGNRGVNVNIPTLQPISEEYISLDKHEETINIGDSFEINATKTYEFNLYKEIKEAIPSSDMSYEVLDTTIATVSGNQVAGVKSGKTYVIATYTDPETSNTTKLRVEVNVLDSSIGETAMPEVSTGYIHNVALKADGTVWGWGSNNYGQLGSSVSSKEETPILLGINDIKDIATGRYHTLMLKNDGTVLAMGYNNYGQLGEGRLVSSSSTPIIVKTNEVDEITKEHKILNNIVKVAAISDTSLALDKDGNMYVWGYDGISYATKLNVYGLKVKDISGNLILTEDGRVWEFANINSIKYRNELRNIVQISSSEYSQSTSYAYYMALDADGNVYTWIRYSYDKVLTTDTTVPTKVETATKFVDIQAGVNVAYAVDKDGKVYSWGNYRSNNATLGLGNSVSTVATPTQITKLENIETINATTYSNSYRRAFAVAKDGSVYGFGDNARYSLLGNGDTGYYYEPKQVGESYAGFIDELGNELTRISMVKGTNKDVTACLMDSFNLRMSRVSTTIETNFTWKVFGDLATISNTTGTTSRITAGSTLGEVTIVAEDSISGKIAKLFIDVIEPETKVAPKVESVGDHSIALKADGTVWTWGNCGYGLGVVNKSGNRVTNLNEPQQVIIPKLVNKIPTLLRTDSITDSETGAVTAVNVYSNGDGNEYYIKGNDFTDEFGNIKIKYINNKYYAWDSNNNNLAGENVVIVDMAASNRHTLLLTQEGDVYSYGYNGDGQLGRTTTSSYGILPEKVTTLSNIVKVAAGENYSLALDKYGRLYTCGHLHFHTSSDSRCHEPIYSTNFNKVSTFDYIDIVDLAKNAIDITNEYILTKDGEVRGLKLYSNSLATNAKLEGITGRVVKITRTSGTNNNGHTAFVTEDGNIYTVGNGVYGQLGNDNTSSSETLAVQVLNSDGTSLTNMRNVYVGEDHTIAVDKAGNTYTWGRNDKEQLRNTQSHLGLNIPRAYPVLEDSRIANVIAVSAGNKYSVVVDETGYVYAWGYGDIGQLGNTLNISSKEAVRVGAEGIVLDTNNVTVQVGGEPIQINAHNKQLNLIHEQTINIDSAVSTDTGIATTTKETSNRVAINPTTAGVTSVIVSGTSNTGVTSENIVQVTVLPENAELNVDMPQDKTVQPMTVSGNSHTLILKSDGTVWSYGDNTYGQTTGETSYSDKVNQVTFPTTSPIISVAAGDYFSVALSADGQVYTWGYNANGELGNGSTSASRTPVCVLNNIVKIAAGANQVLAIDANGYVYSWGKNISGSLGIGSTSNAVSPTKVANISHAIDIAVGNDHAMILTAKGTVYTTGRNTAGQLGVPKTIISKDKFEAIQISEKIEYIAAGNRTSMAISTSGKLYVWGNNTNGQLGLAESYTKVYEPTYVSGINNVQVVSVGENHGTVVTSNGELYVTGSNNFGQLGIGKGKLENEQTNAFMKVNTFGSNVMRANAGTTYTTVITKDGNVYGFGDYNHGNLSRISLTKGFEPIMISEDTSYLDEQEVVIHQGDKYQLNANGRYKLNVLHKDDSTFEYSISNNEIAEIDATTGEITGIKTGTTLVKIQEKDANGNLTGNVSSVVVKVVPVNEDISQAIAPTVEGGDKFAIATNENGTLNIFGDKENIISSNIPSEKNDNFHFETVKAGQNFVVAINNDGTVWTLGDNTYGQVGIGSDEQYFEYMQGINVYDIQSAVQVDAGNSHAIALDELGRVYVWGSNENGQLGIAKETSKVGTPIVIRPLSNRRVISVSAGGNYSAMVDTNGKVYILGDETSNTVIREVTALPQKAVKVVTGSEKTLVLTNNGEVYSINNITLIPVKKTLTNVVDIATNDDTFMCLTANQELYTFENNANGEMGIGNISNQNTPQKVAEKVFTMGGGYKNTYYINVKGEVLASGTNINGELGNGTSGISASATNIQSTTYVKVGDASMKFVPKSVRVAKDWKVLVGDETLKSDIANKIKAILIEKENEFNVFGNKIVDLNDYTFSIKDTTIANITDASILEITAGEKGSTVLEARNKATNEVEKLAIYVVDEDALRIDDVYITDPQRFDSEVKGDKDFYIDVEGSATTGILNIELLYNDNITVTDESGNILSAVRVNDSEGNPTNNWTVSGLDLTKAIQTLKIKLTDPITSNEYEFNVTIYKSIIVKVNSETLLPEKEVSSVTGKKEKVYNKFINPVDTEAIIEVSCGDSGRTMKLLSADKKQELATAAANTALNTTVQVPNIENTFILQIIDAEGNIDESVIRIHKSSIKSISTKNNGHTVVANRTIGTDPYVEEFSMTISDQPETRRVTIKLRNKNVTAMKITQDSTELPVTLTGLTATVDITLPNENETDKTELVVELTTKNGYTEKHIVKVTTISSNNDIKQIVLDEINGTPWESKYNTSTEISDNEHELILHDKEANIGDWDTFSIYPESKKAEVSVVKTPQDSDFSKINTEGFVNFGVHLDKQTENLFTINTIWVKSEDDGIKQHTLYVYKESENAKIKDVNVSAGGVTKIATQKPGTNELIGKVLKGQSNYELEINLQDIFANIESMSVEGIEDASTVLTKVSGTPQTSTTEGTNGKFVYNATSDLLGKQITIVVKPEYDGAKSEVYTLTLVEMDDNANFESVSVDGIALNIDSENVSTNIYEEDEGLLSVKAESDTATITVTDPEGNVISGVSEVTDVETNIEPGETKVFNIVITSEDETNTVTKNVTITKLSGDASISAIIANNNGVVTNATQDEENDLIWNIGISENATNPVITVTPTDANATVIVDGAANGSNVDISDRDSINITVTSQDERNTEEYELRINKLSSNANLKTIEFQNTNGNTEKVIKSAEDPDTDTYNVTVVNGFGKGTGRIKVSTENSNAKVQMAISNDGTNAIPEENRTYVEQDYIDIDTNTNKQVVIRVTAEDGTVKDYTVNVQLEDPILKQLYVNNKEVAVEASVAEGRVDPESTSASVQIDTNYSSVTAEIKYQAGVNALGEPIYSTMTQSIGSSKTGTYTIPLLAGGEGTVTPVSIKLTSGTKVETIELNLVKGSTKAELDKVEFTGITENNVSTATYGETDTNTILINPMDSAHKYDMKALCKENGMATIYQVSDLTTDKDVLDLTDTTICTDITSNTQVNLNSSEYTRFIIVVTSEFEGNSRRYEAVVKEASDDAELKDLTITINGKDSNSIDKHLSDLGTFTHNDTTGYEDLDLIVPSTVSSLRVADLVYDKYAKVEWTEIENAPSTYTEYNSSDEKNYVVTLPEDLEGDNQKHILVKVTSETGTEKIYNVNIIKDTNVDLTNITLTNTDDNTEIAIRKDELNDTRYITKENVSDAVSNVAVKAQSKGAVSIKVKTVEGKEITDNIATTGFELNKNTLSMILNSNYHYTEEGIEKTISSKDAKTIVVEISVKAKSDKMYEGTVFDSGIVKNYELVIVRLISNVDMAITLDDTENTVIQSSEFTQRVDEEGNAILEDGKDVYEYEYLVPSDTTTVNINNIAANSAYSTVTHKGKTNNKIDYSSSLYAITLGTEDKAVSSERIEVRSDSGKKVVYYFNVRKQSENTNIEKIIVNDYEAKKNDETEEFDTTLLAPLNKLDIQVNGVEQNAKVTARLVSANGTAVSNTAQEMTGDNDTRKVNLINQLEDKSNVTEMVVEITVIAEDTNITKTYTLNINVQKAILQSVDGLDVLGNVDSSTKLVTANKDFDGANNKYTTKEIVLESATDTITLTNIVYEYPAEEVTLKAITDNVTITSDGFTISNIPSDAASTTATIEVSARGVTQYYSIVVRNKSTDTTIKEISEDGSKNNKSNTLEIATEATSDSSITVTLNNKNAKVINAVHGMDELTVNDNSFKVTGTAKEHSADEPQDTEEVIVTIQAEDGTKKDYTITLIRKHTETGLTVVDFSDGENTGTLDTTKVNIIASDKEGIYITNIETECSLAKAQIEYIDASGIKQTEDMDATKLYEIAEGETKTFTIIVTSEYGNEARYDYIVKRKSANTDVGIQIDSKDIKELSGIYPANIKVDTESTQITIVPTVEGQKVVSGSVIITANDADITSQLGIVTTDNTIDLSKIATACNYTDDSSEDANDTYRTLKVQFNIAAEDDSVTKQYTVELTRQHIETGLQTIGYNYIETDTTQSATVDAISNEVVSIDVPTTVSEINFKQIIPNCEKAIVEIMVDKEKKTQTEAGFTLSLPEDTEGDGCIRRIVVTVTSEAGTTQDYTIEVTRLARNATLGNVIVNGVEATLKASEDPSIKGIFEVGIRDTAKTANIIAKSANKLATITLKDIEGTTQLATATQKIDYTYTLTEEDLNSETIEFLIKVQAQDGTVATYKLILTRQYANPALLGISIKPTDSTGATGEIKLTNENFTYTSCTHWYGRDYWYKQNNGVIQIPTDWTEITIGDILPNPGIIATITRINCSNVNNPNPNHASTHSDGVIDFATQSFVMPEGEYVYFRIDTKAESGDTTNPYVIVLYKDATSTNATIKVNGKDKVSTDSDGTPVYNVNANTKSIVIKVEGENKLSTRSDITSIEVNGVDVKSLIKVNESISSDSKTITYTLDTNSLDYKFINLKISVSPEDANIQEKEYSLKINKLDNTAEISKVIGNDVEIDIDKEISHYASIGRDKIDNTIYAQYLEVTETQVVTEITTVSKYAKISTSLSENGEYTEIGTGTATTTVDIPANTTRTILYVKVVSEDGRATKYYQIWFVKKSDDASIDELIVTDIDGSTNNLPEVTKVEVDPSDSSKDYYEVDVEDTKSSITLKMTSAYEFAQVSIGGQRLELHTTTVTINNLKTAIIDEATGKIPVELKVKIPAVQNSTGEDIIVDRTLYINRISRNNGIESISTENNGDITFGPYTATEYKDSYDIYLEATGEDRTTVDLTIVPISPKAKVQLYDMENNLLAEEDGEGFLQKDGLAIDKELPTTYKVVVTPQIGVAKTYNVIILPKSSQAGLVSLKIGNSGALKEVYEPGKYDYQVSNLGLTGLDGVVEATAANENCSIKIYTLDKTTEVTKEYSRLEGIDLENTTYVSVMVISPNGAHTSTYTLWLKDVSDDTTLGTVEYNTPSQPILTKLQRKNSSEAGYLGEYVVELEPEEELINFKFTANNPLSKVTLKDANNVEVNGTQILEVSNIDISSMNSDMVFDILVEAESGNVGKYKLTIIKKTVIKGEIIVEGDYINTKVVFTDSKSNTQEPGIDENGEFEIEAIAGDSYTLRIEEEGYLTYEMTNIPAAYGVRTYIGEVYMLAGDVTKDGKINTIDLYKVNIIARKNNATGITTATSGKEYYDFNDDGMINNDDLAILVENFGRKAKLITYERVVKVVGELLDQDNKVINNATIEIHKDGKAINSDVTSQTGEFSMRNVATGEYTLVVKDAEGNIIGQTAMNIAEGTQYSIENNTITVKPNISLVDLSVRANGTIAVISKRGETPDTDITNPVINTIDTEFVSGGIKLTVDATDTSTLTYEFYKVDSGVETLIPSTTNTVIDAVSSTFGNTYTYHIIVTDEVGNKTETIKTITDNRINTVEDLKTFGQLVSEGKTYEGETVTLNADIDLTEIEFTPIGKPQNNTKPGVFSGTFDGNGHMIKNLNINSTTNYAGLFGKAKNATIKNLGIESGTISSNKNYVGALIGQAEGTVVIENCYNKANIEANKYAGGFIGLVNGTTANVTISNCYNTGNVTATERVGGFIGQVNNTNVNVVNCYNIGTITGTIYAGEIIGFAAATLDADTQVISTAKFENCYTLNANSVGAHTNITSTIDSENAKLQYTATVVENINTAELGEQFKIDADINNGNPSLKWEQKPVVATFLSARTNFVFPVDGQYTITSEFGSRIDPVSGEETEFHSGMDIAANYQAPILAIADGTVIFAGENGGYGYCIEIEHIVNGEKVYSFYAHLYEIDVTVGETVKQGQIIGLEGGKVGDVGSGKSTGPHLHFEIRKVNGSYSSAVDPKEYLEF